MRKTPLKKWQTANMMTTWIPLPDPLKPQIYYIIDKTKLVNRFLGQTEFQKFGIDD